MSGLFPFEILEIPATGAYSTLVVARSAEGTVVACKVLKQDLVQNAEALTRLRDEARLLSRLQHPSILRVFALLNLDARPVLVMEWVEGLDLSRLLRVLPEGLPPAVVCAVCAQTASALEAAWSRPLGPTEPPLGLVHRDIKPENLLLDIHGRVRIADFGTAKARFDDREAHTVAVVMGSRGFMAPEWLVGDEPAPTMDVYALGVTAILLLTGKLPVVSAHFERHDVAMARIIETLSPPGMAPDRVELLRDLIRRMCTYEHEDRPSHADVMLGMWDCADDPEGALRAFANTVVRAAFESRERVSPEQHPHFADVSFLGRAERWESFDDPAISAEQSDALLRAFLAKQGWESRGADLQLLLANAGRWTAAPFLDVLARATRPWWKVWVTVASADALALALAFLKQRRSEAVLYAARPLAEHADERVRAAARQILEP